ncbi:uncharacterized protein LY89DRAFT_1665 [Mollisia scopiformis]|uniref:Uncharacterized protein n=1 Tax=Mollisia scopiformis TaxID=149040 RepID=A0A194XVJ4_MOLSC|nr:uncharacterized protein LY89DRAFT_1665 [Mollisia scopiformis]KUJ23732.1 hypothetical protein LY89DRAFT_1665 [Mollisia scopiformis]
MSNGNARRQALSAKKLRRVDLLVVLPVCNYLTCENFGDACVHDAQYSVWGCCQTPYTACQLYTSCLPYSDIASCGPDCSADPYLTICSDSFYPICDQYVLDDKGILASNFYCDSTTDIETASLFATDGDQGFVTYVEVTMSILSASTSSKSTSQSSSSSSTKPSSSPTAIILTTSTSPTPSPTPSPTHTSSPSSTPVGAIAGGTVGGIAVIGAIIVAILLILRRKRNKPSNSAMAATPRPATYDESTAHPPPQMHSSPVPSYDTRGSTYKPSIPMSPASYTPEAQKTTPMYAAGGQQHAGLGLEVTELPSPPGTPANAHLSGGYATPRYSSLGASPMSSVPVARPGNENDAPEVQRYQPFMG